MAESELKHADVKAVHIDRGDHGFGFNIKGTTQTGGKLHAINGRLYAPLQYISHVDEGGSAWNAGLRKADRILSVNGVDARGLSHANVVNQVIKGGGILDLIVLRVDEQEARRLQALEDAASNKKSKNNEPAALISIRDYDTQTDALNKTYTIYNFWIKGEYATSKRFSEMAAFNKALRARFRWHKFPPFPAKRLNGLMKTTLGPKELQERREALEEFFNAVFEVEDIFASELVKTFLKPGSYRPSNAPPVEDDAGVAQAEGAANGNGSAAAAGEEEAAAAEKEAPLVPTKDGNSKPAEKTKPKGLFDLEDEPAEEVPALDDEPAPAPGLAQDTDDGVIRVLLPNRRLLELDAEEIKTAGDALEAALDSVGIEGFARHIFKLFVAHDGTDAAKATLPKADAKLSLLADDASLDNLDGRILLQRWLFTKSQENHADDDETAVDLLFHQAQQAIEVGHLYCGAKKKSSLQAAADSDDKLKFLQIARKLHTYGGMAFFDCSSDHTGEDEDVAVTVTADKLILQVMKAGKPSTDPDDVSVYTWDQVNKVRRRDNVVGFKAVVEDETVTVRITSESAEFLEDCIKRVHVENSWIEDADAEGSFFK